LFLSENFVCKIRTTHFHLIDKKRDNLKSNWIELACQLTWAENKFHVSVWDHQTSIVQNPRLIHAHAFTKRDNIHLYSITVDTKFLGSLGPVTHDTQGQSNVRSYVAKRQSGKKWGDLMVVHTVRARTQRDLVHSRSYALACVLWHFVAQVVAS